jgi:predicted transcriptional regulator
MKTATLPSLRVDPQLRDAAESVLQEGESLSSFIETSVREMVERRRIRTEFIARGLASRDESQRTGVYYSVNDVRVMLDKKLVKAAKRIGK